MNISFTGHRTIDAEYAQSHLDRIITHYAYACEVTFFSGMANGFDLMAAERVLAIREACCNVRLCCVVPFALQSKRYSEADRERYDRVLARADEVIHLELEYTRGVYYRRNQYLVKQADLMIAYYNGAGKGGTAHTTRLAKHKKIEVLNIYPTPQMSLF